MTMKASWIKRIYKTNIGWVATPIFYGLDKIYMYGNIYLQKISTIKNDFWRDLIKSIHFVSVNAPISSVEHLLAMPLWYNTKMVMEKIPSWVDKGIMTIGDIIAINGG